MWSYNIKIIVYSKEGKEKNFTFLFGRIYFQHIFDTNVTLQKVGLKNYLHLEKSTWNRLLQCKTLKLIHNSEKLSCVLSFK